MTSKREKTTVRDITLYTRVEGQGRPIVLMHGGPGADHTTLLPLRSLAATNTLVYYDHRCNGRSLGPAVTSMTWDNLTADADVLRSTLGFDTWTVLGHSFGGMVALEYALRYPQRVSHLILMDTCADIAWAQQHVPLELAERGYSRGAVESARRFFNGQIRPSEMVPCLLQFGKAYTYSFNILHLLHELNIRANAEALIFGFGTLLQGWNVLDQLSSLSMPTLILAGRHDFQFPPEHQKQMAALIRQACLEIMEKAGHNTPTEQPEEVIRLIRAFLG